jgi:RNA-directed DNA polymerase
MDNTDYPYEFEEWLKTSKSKMTEAFDFIGDHPYRHFDGRVTHVDLDSNSTLLAEKLKDPSKLAKHSFYPFIRKDKKVRRYTRDKTTGDLKIGQKVRPIMYASHADACIYAFYSYILKTRYESQITDTPLDESIVAYRKILRTDGSGRGKSNIEFATEVSQLARKHSKCVVLCLDITKFFDTMNHDQVKETWQNVLGVSTLPDGHYMVYKNITKFRYVFIYDALQRLGYGFIRRGKFIFCEEQETLRYALYSCRVPQKN